MLAKDSFNSWRTFKQSLFGPDKVTVIEVPDVPLQQLDVVELSACGKDGEGVV